MYEYFLQDWTVKLTVKWVSEQSCIQWIPCEKQERAAHLKASYDPDTSPRVRGPEVCCGNVNLILHDECAAPHTSLSFKVLQWPRLSAILKPVRQCSNTLILEWSRGVTTSQKAEILTGLRFSQAEGKARRSLGSSELPTGALLCSAWGHVNPVEGNSSGWQGGNYCQTWRSGEMGRRGSEKESESRGEGSIK